jgi:hypothetical protein
MFLDNLAGGPGTTDLNPSQVAVLDGCTVWTVGILQQDARLCATVTGGLAVQPGNAGGTPFSVVDRDGPSIGSLMHRARSASGK